MPLVFICTTLSMRKSASRGGGLLDTGMYGI